MNKHKVGNDAQLDIILADKLLSEKLLDYAKSVYSHENMKFLIDVSNNEHTRLYTAPYFKYLYFEYITTSSPYELNISSITRVKWTNFE
eukprot:Awhi_evm1s7476